MAAGGASASQKLLLSKGRSRGATRAQARLDAAGRRANLQGAFVLGRPLVGAGLRVGLVDDVLSSGATLSAAAAVLRGAGHRVWAVAAGCPFKT